MAVDTQPRQARAADQPPPARRSSWTPGSMWLAAYISFCAALAVLAPVWMTTRSFGGDWWLHLRLLDQQRIAWQTLGHPTLFTSMDPVGALTPMPMLFGASLNALGGLLATAIGTLAAYVALHILVAWCAFFGMWWLTALMGVPGLWRYIPGIALVTSAFFIGDPLGRGGFGEFAATQVLPLCIAGVADVFANQRIRLRSALAVAVPLPVVLGGHTISAVWTSIFAIVLAVSLWVFARSYLRRPPAQSLALLVAGAVCGAAMTVWAMVPAVVIAPSLNAGGATFDAAASRYFGNPAIWLNPLRVLPQEHVEFWRSGATPSDGFQGATSLFVQLPVLFLAWAIIVLIRHRHDPESDLSIVFAKALAPTGLLIAALVTFPELWSAFPGALQSTQYAFRLVSYAQILVAILLGLALRSQLGSGRKLSGSPVDYRMRRILVAMVLLCSAQAIWQGWTTVNITLNRGYDQVRQDALATPFNAVDWYDATQARAKGDVSHPDFWTPSRNNGFTRDTMTKWAPTRAVRPGTELLTPVVAPDDLIEWQDATTIGRSPAGFTIVRITGPDVEATVSPPLWMTLASLISLVGVTALPFVGLGAALEGRKGPGRGTSNSPRGSPEMPRAIPATLALVGLMALLTAAVLPSKEQVKTQAWTMQTGQTNPFVSATGMPQETTITVPCSTFRSIPLGQSNDLARTASTPLAGPGLVLQGQPGRVAFGVDGRTDTWLYTQVPNGECSVRASYNADTRRLTLSAGPESQDITLPTDPISNSPLVPVLALPTSDAPAGSDVVMSIRTYPTTIVSGGLRATAVALAIACGLCILFWARRFTSPVRVLAGPLVHPVDAIVGGLLVLAGVLVPAGFDDGWVLSTVRARETLGHFSNFFTGAGAVQPQGAWWNTLQATYSNSLFTDPAVLLRIPEILCCVVAWILIRRLVTKTRGETDTLSLWAGAVTFTTGAIALMSGIRPEAVVSLLLVSLVVFLVAFHETHSFFYLSAAWVLVGLSIAVHQSGTALLATAAVSLPLGARVFRASKQRSLLLLILAPAVILPAAAILMPGNLTQLLDGLARFQFNPEYHRQFYELNRWLEVLGTGNNGMNPARRLVPVTALAVLLAAWLSRRRLGPQGQYLLLVLTLPWVGLVLTASKWGWHFAVLIPSTAAMVLLCASDWKDAVSGRKTRQLTIVAAFALIGFNVSQGSLDWTQGFDAPVPVVNGVPFSGPFALDSLWLWLAYLCVAVWMVVLYPRGVAMLGAGLVALVIVISGSLQPVVSDAFVRPGSWVAQQFPGLSGRTCGLAHLNVAIQLAKLPLAPNPDLTATPTTSTTNLALPIGPANTEAFTSSQSGISATPWYRVEPGQDLQGWVQTSGAKMNARLEYGSAFGQPVGSKQISRTGDKAWWLWTDRAPDASQYARVTWVSAGESVTVTEPLLELKSRAASDLPAQVVWNNPQNYLQASCFPPIDISDGTIPPLDLSIGLPQWMGTAWIGVNKPVELACPQRTDVLASNTCIYGFTSRPLVPETADG